MTDRELLELAAKAAGEVFDAERNPLERDDLALQLAVRIGIDLVFTPEDVEAVAPQHARQEDQEMISPWACESWTLKPQDPYAATRRAIVRAAAEIGKGME